MTKPLEEKLKAMAEKQRLSKTEKNQVTTVGQLSEGTLLPSSDFEGETAEETLTRLTPVLPKSPEDKRIMANAILRSSLFGVVEKGRRIYEKKILKATVQGLTLRVTGEQLDQSDFDVFLECLHRNQGFPLGSAIRFSGGNFLKSIGRSAGKANYVWLDDVLTRLSVYGIELGDGKRIYNGTLLHEMFRDRETREYVIVLNPKIAIFFTDGLWTGLSLVERSHLKGKQLALWLHGNYSTQTVPFPYKVATIHKNCGSLAVLKEFRRTLKKALSDLSAATGWTCNIDPETDLVHVVKTKAVWHE